MDVLRDFLLTTASRPSEENYLRGLFSKLSHENKPLKLSVSSLGRHFTNSFEIIQNKFSASAASNSSQSKIMRDDLSIK